MKLQLIACLFFAVPAIKASANFKATCSVVNAQMGALSKAIAQVKRTADNLGHTEISNRCAEASGHLNFAQVSWGGISSGFLSFPWRARTSPHAATVQDRLSSCGNSLQWIYQRPELSHPDYAPPVSNCKTYYKSCQTGCNTIWHWPSPPSYGPQPSGGNWGLNRRHKRVASLCPVNEEACPTSLGSSGVECLDTQSELTSCGGCVTKGEGENCLLIPGAEGVGCLDGRCVVFSVKPGFRKNNEGRPEMILA